MSEEEKVVSWFEENYKSLILGIIIGLTILFGYKSYLSNQNTSQLELSRQFDLAVTSYQNGDTSKILSFSRENMNNNSNNVYTSLANLYSAKIMYLDNNIDQSYVFLDHIISNTSDNGLIDIAKYRKAKILIEEMKYSQANELLGDDPDNYQHIELKGDIYYLQNNDEEAVRYYNKVLAYSITPNEKKNIIAKINLIK
tara:strand:+ start:3784 stop:4377 length:594 start_codon:yes stop_codon:yes gene_type:complete